MRIQRISSVDSKRARLLSPHVLYIVVALLVGLYTGLNLSGIHRRDLPDASSKEESMSIPSIPVLDDNSENMRRQIRQAEEERNEWKAQVDKLNKDYSAAINQVHLLETNHCPKELEDSEHNERPLENPNSHPICQHLPYPAPSAMALWNHHILKVLKATKLPNDAQFRFHDFTAELLQIITPRLHRSVKSIPHEWDSVERALTLVWERYQYLQLPTKERSKVAAPPRPLKVLIMGGSLLVGTNCRKLLSELGFSMGLPNRDCSWANRLDRFLDAYAGGDLVEVTKVAMGGTNTATGKVIWQYDLVPKEARHPDIVINAYSTNDMHILTILEAETANVTLRDKVFDMTQDFVRQILHTCDPQRPPPLLVHVDDYLGNEQRKIWDTTELSQGVQVLANYYGFTSFSYADVVREIVYGDTEEAWLSANWWESGKFERQIHPGMGMHIASMWVTVYNLLNLATTYCSIPPIPTDYSISKYQAGVLGLPPLENEVKKAKNKPKPHPKGLPPVLTKNLSIEDITKLWKQSEERLAPCDPEQLQGKEHQYAKCPFSWVGGLSLQQNNETWIQEYFRNQATVWEGWDLGNDGDKLGFVPSTNRLGKRLTNSTDMILEFTFDQTIRSATVFYMKSYGERWENSRIHFRAWKAGAQDELVDERYVVGVHDKSTSEMYTEALDFPQAIPSGTNIKIGATLIGGTMFKIMGLAVCS